MTFEQLIMSELIKDDTEIKILDAFGNMIARGNWFNDDVLNFVKYEISSYTVNIHKPFVIVTLL